MILSILQFLFILAEVIILFNLLIIVHELGHFLAAKWRGLVVERFGIWFGKPLWKKTIGGVEYSLGCIPGGGFVALPQMAPMEAMEGENKLPREALPPVKPIDKIIVALAGPLFSFGLAIAFATVVWVIGKPVSDSETTTVVGAFVDGSPAEQAGMKVGDRILSVDGHPVKKFGGIGDTVAWRVISSEGDTIPMVVERGGETLSFVVKPKKEVKQAWERAGLRQINIIPAQIPMVGAVFPNSPAEKAGLKPNDFIIALNGEKLFSQLPIGRFIEKNPGVPVPVTIQRGTQIFDVAIKPEQPQGHPTPMIGLRWDLMGQMDVVHPTPWEQIKGSVESMKNTLGAVISPKSDIKPQHLSGPVGIMRLYYILFESDQGWRMALWFSVVLNVNLALLNLLPFPVLDGGHITLAIIEWLRGKPLNLRLLEGVQSVCAIVLIGYMLYVSFYDVQDLPWKNSSKPPKELKFLPTEPDPAS